MYLKARLNYHIKEILEVEILEVIFIIFSMKLITSKILLFFKNAIRLILNLNGLK